MHTVDIKKIYGGPPEQVRQNWPPIHPERTHLVPSSSDTQLDTLVNSVLNDNRPPAIDTNTTVNMVNNNQITQLLLNLQEEVRQLKLTTPHSHGNNSKADGFDINAIKQAEGVDIYVALNRTEPLKEKTDATKTDKDNWRDLINEMDKLTESTDMMQCF